MHHIQCNVFKSQFFVRHRGNDNDEGQLLPNNEYKHARDQDQVQVSIIVVLHLCQVTSVSCHTPMTQVPPIEKEEDLRSVSMCTKYYYKLTLSVFSFFSLSFPCKSSFIASSGARGAGAFIRSKLSI